MPGSVFVFFDAKNNNTTIAVGKGRICVPKRDRKAIVSFSFSEILNSGSIEDAFYFLPEYLELSTSGIYIISIQCVHYDYALF